MELDRVASQTRNRILVVCKGRQKEEKSGQIEANDYLPLAGLDQDSALLSFAWDADERLSCSSEWEKSSSSSSRKGEQIDLCQHLKRAECSFMIDNRDGKSNGNAYSAIRRTNNRPTTPLKLLSLWLLLLLHGCLAVNDTHWRSQSGVAQELRSASKEQLWVDLLSSVVGELSAGQEGIQRLARRLSDWPDQRQATLFYLDLLDRRRERWQVGGESGEFCTRASLAELESVGEQSKGRNEDIAWKIRMRDQVRRDRLDLQPELAKLLAKLNSELAYVELAKLAVENANLISRLLIHRETSELVMEKHQLESMQSFLAYLLESKLSEPAKASSLLHSAGLALFADQSEQPKLLAAPLARVAHSNQPPILVELSDHPAVGVSSGPNGYFGRSSLQSFLASWLLDREQLAELGAKLGVENEQFSLSIGDGRWFSPYFDCGLANRWLLTYSIPFFASSSRTSGRRSSIKFR